MQGWQFTAGLAALAITGVLLAPRLGAILRGPAEVPPDTTATVPTPPSGQHILPVVTHGINAATPSPTGHLQLNVGLDRAAVMQGTEVERFLAITVSAPAGLGESWRRPVDLSVVLDASGSMNDRGKIDYAKRAAKWLASSMEPQDTYSLITFSSSASVVVPGQHIDGVHAIHRAIDRVTPRGGTNIYAGLNEGADEVTRHLDGHNVGRVVLLSDGKATHGITDEGALTQLASSFAAAGVTVSTVGLGSTYNEDLLARIADMGGGSYDFVDEPRQLARAFEDELNRSASVVARNTRIQLDLAPGVRGLEIIGWDAEQTADGWSVHLGDVYAGESRKIVMRVRVTGDALGDMNLASVRADYFDLVDDGSAQALASASVRVTEDRRVVQASVDRKRSIDTRRAYGNWYLDKSARAYSRGDVVAAQAMAAQGAGVLSTAAVEFDDEALKAESLNLRQQQINYSEVAPASDAGRRVVKKNKEDFRALAR